MGRDLVGLLAELFTLHGFTATRDEALEGHGGQARDVALVVELDDEAFVADVVDGPLSSDVVGRMAALADDVGATGGLLVHLGGATEEALSGAAGRLILWDRDTFARLLGDGLLAQTQGTTPAPLPMQRSHTETAPSLAHILPPAFRDLTAPAPAATAPLAAPAIPSAAPVSHLHHVAPTANVSMSERVLPAETMRLQVALPAALDLVAGRLAAFEHADLVLQPVHLFHLGTRLMQVNATDQSISEAESEILLDAGRQGVPANVAVSRRALRVQADAAAAVAQAYTVEKGGTAPAPVGLRLRPLWRLWGANGHVDVDGVTGRVLHEELRAQVAA